jgi:hypothetical protein
MKFIFLVLLFTTFSALADVIPVSPSLPTEGSEVVPEMEKADDSKIEEVVKSAEPLPEIKSEITPVGLPRKTSTHEVRSNSIGTIMVGYQLITSWLPSKKTLSYTHIFNEKWSLEGEYAFQSIDTPFIGVDLGQIRERRFILQARRYVGNSFHFSFGPVYNHFKARLGSDILDGLGNEINSEFSAENLGFSGGIGNRWQWSNGLTLGIDWIRLNVPVLQTKVEDKVLDAVPGAEDRDDIKDVIRTFNRIPTFVVLGFNLGYTF